MGRYVSRLVRDLHYVGLICYIPKWYSKPLTIGLETMGAPGARAPSPPVDISKYLEKPAMFREMPLKPSL